MEIPNRGPEINGVCISLVVLSTLAIALRFLSRRLSGAGFWWDDWLSLAALPFAIAENAVNLVEVRAGWGKHAVDAPKGVLVFLRLLFWDELFYTACIALCKFSVLCFYNRTFAVSRQLRTALWVLGGVTMGWWISVTFVIIFQCHPIRAAWLPQVPGNCFNLYGFFVGQAVPNILTDFILLILPLPILWRLRIQLPQKIALVAVFLLGYFVIIVSIVRLVTVISLGPRVREDITWNIVNTGLWTTVEMSIGVFSISIPSNFYLFKRVVGVIVPGTFIAPKRSRPTPNPTPSTRGDHIGRSSKLNDIKTFTRLSDHSEGVKTDNRGTDNLAGGTSQTPGNDFNGPSDDRIIVDGEQGITLQRIHVRNDVTVHYEAPGEV